jgi:hypothetical protein
MNSRTSASSFDSEHTGHSFHPHIAQFYRWSTLTCPRDASPEFDELERLPSRVTALGPADPPYPVCFSAALQLFHMGGARRKRSALAFEELNGAPVIPCYAAVEDVTPWLLSQSSVC